MRKRGLGVVGIVVIIASIVILLGFITGNIITFSSELSPGVGLPSWYWYPKTTQPVDIQPNVPKPQPYVPPPWYCILGENDDFPIGCWIDCYNSNGPTFPPFCSDDISLSGCDFNPDDHIIECETIQNADGINCHSICYTVNPVTGEMTPICLGDAVVCELYV